jgi:mannose-6-phosphate isomerase-like protein (cupin superfamily)
MNDLIYNSSESILFREKGMVQIIEKPTRIQSAGNMPKIILEYIGRVNSHTSEVSLAHMKSPAGWKEPGQQPEFDEYTLVLKGGLQVETRTEVHQVTAGQAVMVPGGEWVRYSTPFPEGAEYIAVCIPAFSPETVHREE